MPREFSAVTAEIDAMQAEAPPRADGPQCAPDGPFSEEPGPARASQFFSAADLAGKPVPELKWVVQGLVPIGSPTLLSGDGGTGKSTVGLQLAVAVVAGLPWLGRPGEPGPALFLSAEDDEAELHRRLSVIAKAEGLDLADLQGLTVRSLAGEDALLAFDGPLGLIPTPLFRELEERVSEERPALVLIDTAADVFPANENDRAKVRQFIGLLRGLAIRFQCAVVLLSHPSVAGMANGSGISGSTAWNGSVRSRLYLSRVIADGYEADPNARVLANKKNNYGPTGFEINLKWQNGVFVAEERETGLDRMAASAKAERVFLKLLRAFTEQGRRVNPSGGINYAPKQFAEHKDCEGVTKRALKGAMDGLLTAGKIKVLHEGPKSRRVSFLAEAGQ